MGSPITFSGFNNIDFNQILEVLSAQERQPVAQLETQRAELQAQQTAFGTLASRLSAFETAAANLASATAFGNTTASISNSQIASVSGGNGGAVGSYSLVVNSLARAQVTATDSAIPDDDTTIVASGGTLAIGGATVTLTGDVTLRGLATAINETDDIGVVASVVRSGNSYRLVLTGRETGAEAAFAVTNNLTGGAGVSFAATNAQEAQDASFSINNVAITSATNTVTGAIPGVDLTLQQESPTAVTVTITADTSSVEALVKSFTSAYNDLSSFLDAQIKAWGNKDRSSIGGDALVRQLRNSLSRVVGQRQETGGELTSLAQVGLTFNRTGQLEFRAADLLKALSSDRNGVMALFQGTGSGTGVFDQIRDAVQTYTSSGGLIPAARTRLSDQVSKIGRRIDDLEVRLAVRKEALRKEFTATDLTISQLNASLGQLGSLSSGSL